MGELLAIVPISNTREYAKIMATLISVLDDNLKGGDESQKVCKHENDVLKQGSRTCGPQVARQGCLISGPRSSKKIIRYDNFYLKKRIFMLFWQKCC